eukprot:8797234-Pyramimonas_sp.AAC.1
MGKAMQRQLEMTLADKWGAPPGSRVSFDLVRAAVRPKSRRLNKHQTFLVRTSAVEGHWTKERARLRGYQTDGLCKCGAADTVHHRLFVCSLPEVIAARAESE